MARVASDKPAAKEAAPADPVSEAENQSKLHFFIFDNKKMLWNNDWELYRTEHGGNGDETNCRLAESDNWLGA